MKSESVANEGGGGGMMEEIFFFYAEAFTASYFYPSALQFYKNTISFVLLVLQLIIIMHFGSLIRKDISLVEAGLRNVAAAAERNLKDVNEQNGMLFHVFIFVLESQ